MLTGWAGGLISHFRNAFSVRRSEMQCTIFWQRRGGYVAALRAMCPPSKVTCGLAVREQMPRPWQTLLRRCKSSQLKPIDFVCFLHSVPYCHWSKMQKSTPGWVPKRIISGVCQIREVDGCSNTKGTSALRQALAMLIPILAVAFPSRRRCKKCSGTTVSPQGCSFERI